MQPKFVVVAAHGITHASHQSLPLPLKPFYSWVLPNPHADKLALERLIAHCAGWPWPENGVDIVDPTMLSREMLEDTRLPKPGQLSHVVILRPSLLTDGACKADAQNGKAAYRAEARDIKGAYTISRRDVAHFIVENALQNWDQWQGKCVTLTY